MQMAVVMLLTAINVQRVSSSRSSCAKSANPKAMTMRGMISMQRVVLEANKTVGITTIPVKLTMLVKALWLCGRKIR